MVEAAGAIAGIALPVLIGQSKEQEVALVAIKLAMCIYVESLLFCPRFQLLNTPEPLTLHHGRENSRQGQVGSAKIHQPWQAWSAIHSVLQNHALVRARSPRQGFI